MSWWEADPVAAPAVAPAQAAPTNAGGSWWENDPPADRAAPPPGPGVNTTIRPNAKQPPVAQVGSYGQNLGRQAMQGVTFGFADEIGARLGALKAFITDDEYNDLYTKILERNRAQDKQFSEENPVAATAAQIGGALVTAPFTPALQAARGASLGARMGAGAATAAGYGALYGAGTGEGLEDRAAGAATGLVAGGVTGGAFPVLAAGLRRGADFVTQPIRRAINPDREAARTLGQGFATDGVDIASAQRALELGRQGDVPLVVADVGGDTVRRLARGAATAVPDVEQKLKTIVEQRAAPKERGERVKRLFRGITGASEDSEGVLINLRRQADAANDPAYKAAYSAPRAQAVWTPELEQLTAAPDFQRAMRAAERVGRNDAALKGFPPIRQPFNFNPDGTVVLKPGAVPNLQFWDYVHRALQQSAEAAGKKSRSEAAQLGALDRQLKDHLDIIVPEFGQARAGAAAFFGMRDAAEVGEFLVTGKMEKAALQRAWGAMKPAEKALARETYANEFLRKVGETGRLPRMTPQRVERMEIILGPQGARRVEAMARVENTMDMLRNALGGSNTAQKLVDLGLVSAAGGGAYYDSSNLTAGALMTLALRGGTRMIDARVLRRLGDMLVSDDPQVLDKAIDMVTRNATMMDAVRKAEARLARSLAPVHPDTALRNVIGGATDESDQPRDNLGR